MPAPSTGSEEVHGSITIHRRRAAAAFGLATMIIAAQASAQRRPVEDRRNRPLRNRADRISTQWFLVPS